MEVLEAYCNSMLGNASKTRENRLTATETLKPVINSQSRKNKRKQAATLATQLRQAKQALWSEEDHKRPPSQGSLPHIAGAKYNRKKRIKTDALKLGDNIASLAQANSGKIQSLAFEDSEYSFTSAAADAKNQKTNGRDGSRSVRPRQRVTTFICNKGGTGKTTSCVNVAGWLAKLGKRVLVIDLDAQASATVGMNIKKTQINYSSADCLNTAIDLDACILKTNWRVDVVPANTELMLAERALALNPSNSMLLSEKIGLLRTRYDHILIDAPAGHGSLTINALAASNDIIMPMDTSSYSEEACSILLEMIDHVRQITGKKIDISNILLKLTAGNYLNRFSHSDRRLVRNMLDSKGFNDCKIIEVPYSASCERAARQGMMLADYAPSDSLSRCFRKIAKTMINDKVTAQRADTKPEAVVEFTSINYQQVLPDAELN